MAAPEQAPDPLREALDLLANTLATLLMCQRALAFTREELRRIQARVETIIQRWQDE